MDPQDREFTMPLALTPLMHYKVSLELPDVVGDGPLGQRQIFVVTHGEVDGDRVRGRIRPGGGDWLLVGADGIGRLDVRGTIATDDGAFIYISYFGLAELTERAMQALTSGPPTEYGEISFITQPRFETGDSRYTWLNTVTAIAEGRLHPGPGVEYQVYEVRNHPGQ